MNMIDTRAVQEAYGSGFESGLNWPDAWMNDGKPGGPWVPSQGYTERSHHDHEQKAAERKAWCDGWEDGLARKISTNRVNPFRSTDENAKHHRKKGR